MVPDSISCISVGQYYPEYHIKTDGVFFDFSDIGATLTCLYKSPSPQETGEFKIDKDFEMRMARFENTIFITAKFGQLNWLDASYNPHLSTNLTKIEVPGTGHGFSLNIIFADSNTGIVQYFRLIGLSHDFSIALRTEIVDLLDRPFDPSTYEKYVGELCARYSTEDIVKLSRVRCRINGALYND